MPANLIRLIAEEVAPFDGRLATAWRMALVCSLTALVFMVWQLPLVAIACYLVLFVMKPDPAETTLMALGICVLVSLVVGLLVVLVRLSIDIPMWRLVIIAAGSFLFLFLGAASKLGPAGSILALVIAFVMTLLGSVPVGELATRALLYAWLMALIPMGLILVCTAVFGRSVPRLLKKLLAQRLRVAARVQAGRRPMQSAWFLLRQGNTTAESYLRFIKLFHLVSGRDWQRLKDTATRSYAALLTTVAPAAIPVPDDRASLPDPPAGFFHADALSNPVYQRFALKTTLAALIAYITYTALGWQDIHTAMVTCYVAALGSTGETVHKLVLRIVGCLVGAAMGIFSILVFMPHMTSIGSLMVLVFAGAFVASWVACGSERSAYAGVQIGLAFLMTVLQGFGPDVQVSVALDRVIGILLGNLVMYLVFTRIWPVSVSQTVQAGLNTILDELAWFADHAVLRASGTVSNDMAVAFRVCTPDQAAQRLAALDGLREQLERSGFEPRSFRTDHTQIAFLRSGIEQVEQWCVQMAQGMTGPDLARMKAGLQSMRVVLNGGERALGSKSAGSV